MTFWLCLAAGVGLSLAATRGRRIDRWSRVFWGLLLGIGAWLVLLALLPGG